MRLSGRDGLGRSEGGFAMLEVLVSLLLAAFAVVAMAGLQSRAATVELEATQRSQALVLVQDMAERIRANPAGAADYVADGLGLVGAGDCTGLGTLAARDACEWSKLLRGASTTRGGRDIGAMIGARGCVSATGPSRYVVTVAWQGAMPGAAPASACGRGGFGGEALRRSVSLVVQVPNLVAP